MNSKQNDMKAARGDQPVQPRSDGFVGVFATLVDQHAESAALCAQLASEPAQRSRLWPEVRRRLVAHEHAEVREVFPVLRQLDTTRALADHHDHEARELDGMIQRLEITPVESEVWGALFEQVVATVLHHAKDEEEQQIFPVAQRALGEARCIELDAKYLLAYQQMFVSH